MSTCYSAPPCRAAAAAPPRSPPRLCRRRLRVAGASRSGPGQVEQRIEEPRLDMVAYTLIIDDLVFWDGSTCMGQLGGGGPQALWGYLLYHAGHTRPAPRVGLAAGAGDTDLPDACAAWLRQAGVLDGLAVVPGAATPRAWQVLEQDGTRHEVWRTPCTEALASLLRPPPASLPAAALRSARAYHIGIDPGSPPLGLLRELRAAAGEGGLLSVESFKPADAPLAPAELRALATLCHVLSPNAAEAASMLGQPPGSARANDPEWVAEALLDAGAQVAAVRLGSDGAVLRGQRDAVVRLPAWPGTMLVDTTGCGNAFCGALLAALQAGETLGAAGAWAAAAASLVAEVRGTPPPPTGEDRRRAAARAADLTLLACGAAGARRLAL